MALLSGEVETKRKPTSAPCRCRWFRMALLSGEVETTCTACAGLVAAVGSGWLCYPGKLKRLELVWVWLTTAQFRMALLSGEVETDGSTTTSTADLGSGWLCYPGKLKLGWMPVPIAQIAPGSGWLCYPGKLKPVLAPRSCSRSPACSGWLCYPGKLKRHGRDGLKRRLDVPDGFAIRGS